MKCQANATLERDTGMGLREGWKWTEGAALSGVDGDNLAAPTADQEDPVKALG